MLILYYTGMRRAAGLSALLAFNAVPSWPQACSGPIDALVSRTYSVAGAPRPPEAVVFYYACRALAAGKREPCDHMRGLLGPNGEGKEHWSPSRVCLDTWRDMTRTKIDADAKKPGALAVCVEFLRVNPDDECLQFKDPEAACETTLRTVGQPEKRWAELVPMSRIDISTRDAFMAAKDERELIGNFTEEKCLTLSQHRQERCLSSLAFQKAYARGDAALCGKWTLCKALLGSAESCDAYAKEIREAACAARP